ncbi:MAG: hypothetical protein ACRENH_15625 [Gemmatimonadaceae bacterium]
MKCRYVFLAPVFAFAACSQGEKQANDTTAAAPETPAMASIDLVATDYAFQAPDTVSAGPTWVRMTNNGKELHHVIIARIDSGHTSDEFLKELGAGKAPAWAKMIGGPIAPNPGGTPTQTAVPLAPGMYTLFCVVPTSDGIPHVAKGMVRQMVVTPATAAAASAPIVPTTTMTLTDYSFNLTTPLTAGKNTIRVVNSAAQPHEVIIVRLLPGKTVQDVAAFAEKLVGPPPAEVIGGASFIVGDVANFVELDLTPGDYGLLCFMPDAKDGKAHAVHGMIQAFKIG